MPTGVDVQVNVIAAGNQLAPSVTALADGSGRLMEDAFFTPTEEVFFTLIDVPAPAFTSGTTGSIPENTPTSVVAYDADATSDGPITYSLSGVDRKLFAIDPHNGQVRFLASPNFEAPADKGADNVYDIVVHARDGLIETTRPVAITVTNVSAAVGKTPVALAGDVQVNSYTVGTQSEAAVTSLPDGGFVVTWSSSDGTGGGISGQRYAEDGTAIGSEFKVNTYTKSDQSHASVTSLPDGGFVVTWLSLNQDGSSNIFGQRYAYDGSPVGGEFKVNTAGVPGEPAATSLSDGGFLVTWTSLGDICGQRYEADGTAQGGEFKVNTYTANNQSNSSATSLPNGGIVVTWSSLDQDHYGYGIYGQRYAQDGSPVNGEFRANTEIGSDQHYSSVTSLPDGGFVVTWASLVQDGSGRGVYGQRYAADGTSVGDEFRLNQITAGDQGNVTLYGAERVTSLHDGRFVQVWSGTEVFFRLAKVAWGDDDTAPSITSDGGQGTASLSVAENTNAVTTVVASDTDDGQTLTYHLAGGADAAAFTIDGTSGALSFIVAPDFEAPAGANKDNVYEVVVEVSDGAGGTASQAIGVTVTNVNAAPTITSGTASTVAESAPVATVVYDAEAKDDGEDRGTLTYTLAAGGDRKLFDIDAGTGGVTFKAPADFEVPGDADGNNVYEIIVQVSDGSLTGSQAVSITVTDQNDVAPVITTQADLSIAENTLVVAALTSTDVDTAGTNPAQISVSGGSDAALFDVADGNLVFKKASDFETDPHSYLVEVTASDSMNHSAKKLTITLTDQNDTAPVITTDAALSLAENKLVVAALTSSDADTVGTAPAEFSISGGADAALFDVAGGNLVFKKPPDFETDPHSYQVEVTASDGVNHSAKLIAITLVDQNDVTPVITTAADLSVAENTLVVAALTSSDVDTVGTAPANFSVTGGADAALFDVAAGNLVFKKAVDFETDPRSYQVEVTASDGVNHSTELLTVTLTDVDDVVNAGDVGAPFDHLGALKDAYILLQGTPQLSINAQSGVLFNDQKMSAGTAGLVTGPGDGSVELNDDGSFVYSPLDGFVGLDSFSYKATSTGGVVDSAQALVYVVPVIVGPTTSTLDLLSLSREEQLAATYVSYLGRGADRDGFDFWVKQFIAHEKTANPGDLLAGISDSFAVSDEAKGVYSFLANPHGTSDAQIDSFLDSAYLNLFNRTADEAGRAYWSNVIKETLAAGGSVGSILTNIVSGAQNTAAGLDITTLMSKVAVNLEYVHAQHEVGNAWTPADDRARAVGLLDPVGSDLQSVPIGVASAYDIAAAHII